MSTSLNIIKLEDVHEFDHQVAGHIIEKVRRYRDAFVLKPCLKPDLFLREIQFYEKAQTDDNIRPWLPAYHGLVHVPSSSNSPLIKGDLLPCMVLEDLTVGFSKPCLIDIKIGRQTFEPSASQAKKSRELAKYPHQEALGFRITGLKVWDAHTQCYRSLGKEFGRALQPDRVLHGLGLFFHNGLGFRHEVLQGCLEEVGGVACAMRTQTSHLFFCSSLLLVYDGEVSNQRCRVGVIDFAHVVPMGEGGRDEGYFYSVQSLHKHLSQLLELSQEGASDGGLEDFVQYRRQVFSIDE